MLKIEAWSVTKKYVDTFGVVNSTNAEYCT